MAPRQGICGLRALSRLAWPSATLTRPLASQMPSSPRQSSRSPHHRLNSSISNPPKPNQQMPSPSPTPHIHILGLGNLAKLFAHSLSLLPHPPQLTLLTHRPSLPPSSPITLVLTRNSTPLPSPPLELSLITPQGPAITHLILTTKSPSSAAAVAPLLPRLSADSTILFTQNGIGAVEEVSSLFPADAQPTYLSAIVTHGVFSTGQFSATHAGVADLKIGPVSGRTSELSTSARWLVDTILSSEALAATEVGADELLHVTLEKLVANAVINPLTAIFRIPNGSVLSPSLTPLRTALASETSLVILSHLSALHPDSPLPPSKAERFSVARLAAMVEGVCEATRGNRSSMLQDVEAGRGTEVGYINGWIVGRGEEMGVGVGVNAGVMGMVERGEVVKIEEVGRLLERMREGVEGR
ncbi:2-dehydropantoate 2-reductase (Ketopantoate reductase) (KPA reductase) (KPR) [Pseudogymnoascus destructans]|uniref:2-dehydropantoate 2-reductase n=1 Tax=Pseudogymnoascus destructans TaxID=655981 RepID=A0A177A3B0_9PEZI|nr:2-dehydropantoate 2-reductase (Ketopantoate reductase) (KPA reductase) (KPR) [Pseudogymnoascus destructans]OAF55751.2 2-dehydropantoate 2-reductase (Ketopantoate reductase) (KPA reductase) (KPR) [Pseudogymnoascus destructans]